MIELETERLRLRQWRDADLEPFAAINANPTTMQFFPKLLSRAESDAMARKIQSLIARNGWGFWAVEEKGGEPFIGFVGLHTPEFALPCSPCVEIAWRLAATHWDRGYASEAARAALHVAFARLKLPEVIAFTSVGNLRSRRVMERIGMHYGGEFDHPAVAEGHDLKRHVLYRLKADEYRVNVP